MLLTAYVILSPAFQELLLSLFNGCVIDMPGSFQLIV
jgi:hypothetical protein